MRTYFPGTHTLNHYVISPSEVKEGDLLGIRIVAVIYNYPFWAAYYGPTNWSDEEIADHGDKLAKDTAEELFSSVANSGRIYNE